MKLSTIAPKRFLKCYWHMVLAKWPIRAKNLRTFNEATQLSPFILSYSKSPAYLSSSLVKMLCSVALRLFSSYKSSFSVEVTKASTSLIPWVPS